MKSIHAGVKAPDFAATTLDGKPFKLSDHRGKIVLVDFWATWCGPCVAELPNVKSLYEEFGGDNFVVVGISFDRDEAAARKFTSDRQLPWIQIWAKKADKGPIAGLYGVGGIPATFLIGRDGKVIERDLRGDALAKAVSREVRKVASGGASEENAFARAVRSFFGGGAKARRPVLPEASPEAREALELTLARYRELKSYRDSFSARAQLIQKHAAPQVARIDGTLAWAGNRIAAKSDLLHVYADGRKVTRYWPEAGRYMRQDQPADLSRALRALEWSPFGEDGPGMHPLATILVGANDNENSPILVVTDVEPVTREDRPGHVLRGRFRVEGLPHGEALPFEAFVDDERHLFEEFRLDYTEAYRAALRESCEGDPEAVERAEIVIELRNIETDVPLEDAEFKMNVGGAREFNLFTELLIDEEPQPDEIQGRNAPTLAGTTHDGSHFDLAGQRGKAVVVCFWASWSPQVEKVLRKLQDLNTGDAANVVVVGVCRNGEAGDAAARRIVASTGATFPQISDHDGRIGEAWNVTCLPLIYVVDPNGYVSEAFLSWSEDTSNALAACVANTEDGRPTISTMVPTSRPGHEESGGLMLKADNEPLGDARVSVETADRLMASQWKMSEQDIDDDGMAELIFPNFQEGITIIDPRTGGVRHLRLPGLDRASVESVRGVRVDGEMCWLITASRFDPSDSEATREAQVSFYSPRGELLWKYQPESTQAAGTRAQAVAGDLDGDGHIEYVIGLTTFKRAQTADESSMDSMRGRLIWLDHNGLRIAERSSKYPVELLYVAETPVGQPATLLCISSGRIHRYTLSAPEQDSNPLNAEPKGTASR